MNALKLGVIVLFLAAAAGCSASTSAAEKSDGPPKDGGSYESPVDIVETLDKADVECSGLSEMPGADDPAMTQNCTAAGENVIVRVFDSTGELDRERGAFDGAGIFEGKSMQVGVNWNLVGPHGFVDDAADVLGGETVKND